MFRDVSIHPKGNPARDYEGNLQLLGFLSREYMFTNPS